MNKKNIIIISVIIFLIIIVITIILLKNNNSNEEVIKVINLSSSEGKECTTKLLDYLADKENKDIRIIKIEKHEYDIIGDGYAMGTDKEPVVIGHHLFYNITVESNAKNYIYRYIPETNTFNDISYQFE